jgi:hypothetical protein
MFVKPFIIVVYETSFLTSSFNFIEHFLKDVFGFLLNIFSTIKKSLLSTALGRPFN